MQQRGIIAGNPFDDYRVSYIGEIVYAKRSTRDLKMRLMTPNSVRPILHRKNGFTRKNMDSVFEKGDNSRVDICRKNRTGMPALIILMGSGFNGSEGYAGLPTWCDIARRGVVVAGIDYRGASLDDTQFPDAIQDAKEAVRYLRVHANEYEIDPEKIFLMGTSSGGYTATFAGITGDEPEFVMGDNQSCSSKVKGVIDCFGPVDFLSEREDRMALGRSTGEICEEVYALLRNDAVKDRSLIGQTSILNRINSKKEIPPILILHGDRDMTVPHRQSERLYETLCETGKDVMFYTVAGAGHEKNFWSREVMQLIMDFLLGEKSYVK